MCAMTSPYLIGKSVTSRFLRHFNILSIDEFSKDTLKAIFSKIVLWHLDARYGMNSFCKRRANDIFLYISVEKLIKKNVSEDFQKSLIHVLMKSFSVHFQFTV